MRIASQVTAVWFLAFGLVSLGCVDKASKNNDSAQSIAGMGGAGAAASGGATTGNAAAASGGAGSAAAGRGTGGATAGSRAVAGSSGAVAGSGGAVAGSGGAISDEDAGVVGQAGQSGEPAAGSGGMGMSAAGSGGMPPSTAPDPSLVVGTGKMCSSYGMPANGKCGGYFCGVDQATLMKAVDPKAVCGADVGLLCSNKVITAVGKCARDVKSAMPLASNDQLRPMVQACVFQDAELQQKVTPECLGCTIDAAQCAGDNCLLDCLAGDSSGCDNCRKQFNCDQPVFTCGGIPSPL